MNYKNFKKLFGDGAGVKRHGDGEGAFTLIELLIVIAILGTLAVVVLLALNPVQQLARTRDAGRISGVAQLGHAIEANATSNNGLYLVGAAGWLTTLQTSGEIGAIPPVIAYSAPASGQHPAATAPGCVGNEQNQFCYLTDATRARAIVFTRLESGAQNGRCPVATQAAWAVYSTANSSGGVLCTANATTYPAVPAAGGYTGNTWLQ